MKGGSGSIKGKKISKNFHPKEGGKESSIPAEQDQRGGPICIRKGDSGGGGERDIQSTN